MKNPNANIKTDDSDSEDDIFAWAADVYQNPEPSPNLSQYGCSYSIDKEPTGDEKVTDLQVWRLQS